MVPLIVSNPIEVESALLDGFGLTKDLLLEVVWRMVRVRRDCTSDYPAGAQPILAYHAGTERLRSVAAAHGYVRNDVDQIESAFHSDLGIKIVVANTDEGTGLEDASPRNVSGKGPATRRVVNSAQGSFMAALDASLPVIQLRSKGQEKDGGAISFWYLCVFETTDEVRAELSQPKSLSGDFFSGFHRRIFLIGREGIEVPAADHGRDKDDDGAFEFDIPVVRK